jgi:hypothetical protein
VIFETLKNNTHHKTANGNRATAQQLMPFEIAGAKLKMKDGENMLAFVIPNPGDTFGMVMRVPKPSPDGRGYAICFDSSIESWHVLHSSRDSTGIRRLSWRAWT